MKKFLTFIICTMLIALSVKSLYNMCMKAIYPLRYYEHIKKYSDNYNLDEYLVMALIKAESNYIYDAHSGIARGLMQITDETAMWISQKMDLDFSIGDIENPEININMGCFYLDYLMDYYNQNEQLALCAYNAGMGNVNKWLKNDEYSKDGESLDIIPFAETKQYVEKIEKYKEIYIDLYKNKEEKL